MYFPQLRSFQAGTVEGSFTSVAKRLNMSKPIIIQQIRQLETVYEMEIFYRQRRWIELSEVGRILLTATERRFTTSGEPIALFQRASAQGTEHLWISAVGPLDLIPVIALVVQS